MSVYNKGFEKKSPIREIERQRPIRESKPKERIKFESVNSEYHEDFMAHISQLNGKPGLYDRLLYNLRLAEANNEITKQDFFDYKELADKQMQKKEKQLQRKQEKDQKSNTSNSNSSDPSNYVDYEQKKEKKETEWNLEKKVRGEVEKIPEEKYEEEHLKKTSRFRKIFEFLKTPLSRVIIFVILGIFLLFYLTKSGISQSLESPFFIIVAILFMILILGRGGKTRKYYPEAEY